LLYIFVTHSSKPNETGTTLLMNLNILYSLHHLFYMTSDVKLLHF